MKALQESAPSEVKGLRHASGAHDRVEACYTAHYIHVGGEGLGGIVIVMLSNRRLRKADGTSWKLSKLGERLTLLLLLSLPSTDRVAIGALA